MRVIREIKLNGKHIKLLLQMDCRYLTVECDGVTVEWYCANVWDNIKNESWIIDTFFKYVVERYISSKPSNEYIKALKELNKMT